jgi:hypothetical protein
LKHKGKDVANDKDLGQPPQGNLDVPFSVHHGNDPPKFHVNRGGEEGGGDEQESRLHDERAECPIGALCA